MIISPPTPLQWSDIPTELVAPIGRSQMMLIQRARKSRERVVVPIDVTELKACQRLAARDLMTDVTVGTSQAAIRNWHGHALGPAPIGRLRAFKLTQLGRSVWYVVLQ